MKKIILIVAIVLFFAPLSKANATWVYTAGDLPYRVGTSAVTANAGPDMNLVPPAVSVTVTGSASSTTGTIVSSTWTYIGCTPSCTQPGFVVTPNQKNSATHITALANMGGAPIGTVFTYRYSVIDSNGNPGSDDMVVKVVAGSGTDLTATYLSPFTADPGMVTLKGKVLNLGGTATNAPFTSYFEVKGNNVLTWTSPAITLDAGKSDTVSVTRQFGTGSYQVQVCADGANKVTETDEGNNCSGWSPLNIAATPPPPPAGGTISAKITANPTSIVTGGKSTLSWTCSQSATSCVGTNFATGGAKSGTLQVSPSSDTTYTVTASDSTSSDSDSVTVKVSGAVGTNPECSDKKDNDKDGKIDYGQDPGCSSPTDNDETDPSPIFIEL